MLSLLVPFSDAFDAILAGSAKYETQEGTGEYRVLKKGKLVGILTTYDLLSVSSVLLEKELESDTSDTV